MRNEVEDWRAPPAWFRVVIPDVSWNGGSREVPDLDAFSFDLRNPNTTTFLIEGVAECAIGSNDAATSGVVVAVGLEDISCLTLSCHGAYGRFGVEGDLVSGEMRNRLDNVNLGIEVTLIFIVMQEPADSRLAY